MNTSYWKTHAVGRFLIDLPPDAKCKFSALFWKEDITWRKDLTVDAARTEASKLADEFRATPHTELAGKSQLIDVLDLPGGGIAVHRWRRDFSTDLTVFDVYFVSQDDRKRVFFYSMPVDVNHFESGRQLIVDMAETLFARDEYEPLPTDPGFAFEGGFSKHTGEWRAERSIVAFREPLINDVVGALYINREDKNSVRCQY